MVQTVRTEGAYTPMRGAGANIVRGVASAGVLSIYDQAQRLIRPAYSSRGGRCYTQSLLNSNGDPARIGNCNLGLTSNAAHLM